MTMPGDIVFDSNTTYFGGNLTDYVNNGTIAEERVTVRGFVSLDRTLLNRSVI